MKRRQPPRSPGRPKKPPQKLPTFSLRDLPKVRLPKQTRSSGGKTKLTERRAAIILYAVSCGCYRETAAEMAGVKAETLSHWMRWEEQPYKAFQTMVRKAEADLEARMVTAITSKVDVRPELALAVLERKFPQRWSRTPSQPPAPIDLRQFGIKTDLGSMLEEAMALALKERAARAALPPPDGRPRDPRPPKIIEGTAMPMD